MFLLKKIKGIFTPCPSFFDICVAGLLAVPYLKGDWNKGTFIISYCIFLALFGLMMKPRREYRSIPLSLLAIWSLINVFIHSLEVSPRQVAFKCVNYELMMEGFLYLFAAILFIHTVVRYSINLKFIYFLIPVAILPWYVGLVRVGSVTPVAAMGVAIVVYLFLSKRFIPAILATLTGAVGVIANWPWICMKWACRPMVWSQMIPNIVYRQVRYVDGEIIDPGIHLSPKLQELITGFPRLMEVKPWLANIFGSGFENTVNNKYLWVDKDIFGWSYMHGDPIHLAMCLGPIALVLLIWFIISCFRRIGVTAHLIPFLTVVLICSFQLTMWQPGKAGVYLLIGTVALVSKIKRREECEEDY